MNILYLLTYDYSFKSWNDSGNLSRELQYFNVFKLKYPNVNFIFLSYGDSEDLEYANFLDNSQIYPVYSYMKFSKNRLKRLLKSFLIPFVLYRKLKIENIQIIKQNQLQGVWVSIILKILLKVPLITRTGYDVFQFKLKENSKIATKFFYYIVTQLAIIFSSIYSVTSNIDKNFLEKYFLFSKQKIHIRPNFVITQDKKSLSERDEKIISVGRLEEQKNLNYLINELGDLDVAVDHYGNGSKYNELVQLAKDRNINIQFKDSVDNLSLTKKYTDYQFFISTSLFEGNPKSLLEALAAGCIVLAPSIPNIKEIVQHEYNGFLFDLEKQSLNNLFTKINSNQYDLEKISNNAIYSVKVNNDLNNLIDNEFNDLALLN